MDGAYLHFYIDKGFPLISCSLRAVKYCYFKMCSQMAFLNSDCHMFYFTQQDFSIKKRKINRWQHLYFKRTLPLKIHLFFFLKV